jgi:hypothetical protein
MPTTRLLRQPLRPLHPLPAHILNPTPQLLLHDLNHSRPPLSEIPIFFAPATPDDAVIARAGDPQHFFLGVETHCVGEGVDVRAQRAVRRRHLLVHEGAFQ